MHKFQSNVHITTLTEHASSKNTSITDVFGAAHYFVFTLKICTLLELSSVDFGLVYSAPLWLGELVQLGYKAPADQ